MNETVSVPPPTIACCNFIPDRDALKEFALRHGFSGVDWTFTVETLPRTPREESALVDTIAGLYPLEVRYHCALSRVDLGDLEMERAEKALRILRGVCRLVWKLGGKFLTIHVGLGLDSTNGLSWERTVDRLAFLVRIANENGVRLCLENLARGWTSRPELYERLMRKSGCWGTFDMGHAQVSPSVTTQRYRVDDFLSPHADRFLNAHIYHTENGGRHLSPASLGDVAERLGLIRRLPHCDWWVLELREEKALLETLGCVREFLSSGPVRAPAGRGQAPSESGPLSTLSTELP
jgi:sugar phosphate isomerase/epimerase